MNYYIYFLGVICAIVLSIVILLLSYLFSKNVINLKKRVPYECGFDSFSSARVTFDVHFYIVALLFLIFDVEIIFVYPWALAYQELTMSGIISMYLFLLIIIVGFYYEWNKGALDWSNKFWNL